MKLIANYYKNGNKDGNYGSIIENTYAGEVAYIATVAVDSKTYKSVKSAEKFMAKYNYIKEC